MTSQSVTRALSVGLVLCLVAATTGCMFKMRHAIPMQAYFNRDEGGRHRVPFHAEAMKNWALAGLVPYSNFGAADLVEPRKDREISDLSIETEFTGLDTLIWVIPGFAYGYYVWAPRHVKVSGEYVDGAPPTVPAESTRFPVSR